VLADELGRSAAELDIEHAFYQIGLLYNVMLPAEWRSTHGVYYTPPTLTERLLDQATSAGVDWRHCRVLDPACGGGAFLAPIARRMAAAIDTKDSDGLVEQVSTRLRGYELDPFAAWLSQVALEATLRALSMPQTDEIPTLVEVCDTLDHPIDSEGFDLVIGNPPYGRTRLNERQRQRFRRTLYGHANLYGLFTDIALQQTRAGGVIAFVTPTSFLAGGYFKNLRKTLAQEAAPVTLDFVDARKGVFEDVLQETLLACYRKDGQARSAHAHTLTANSNESLSVHKAGTFVLPPDKSAPWLVPRNANQGQLIERASTMAARLADWGYRVSTGPLVWNRHKDRLRDVPGKDRLPLIWAESITATGHFVFRAEKRNHKPYFSIESNDAWLVTKTPCVLLQRTTAKEQRRRLIATELPKEFLERHGGVVIENHINMIRPITDAPAVAPGVVAAFLNSSIVDVVFRCLSGSVAVSAYELNALPLPSPDRTLGLATLIQNGASRETIDHECARLYGMELDEEQKSTASVYNEGNHCRKAARNLSRGFTQSELLHPGSIG